MKSNKLICLAVAVCMLFAGSRIAQFCYVHLPVGVEGTCLQFSLPDQPLGVYMVLKNYTEYCTLIQASSTQMNVFEASYEELRDNMAKEVQCE